MTTYYKRKIMTTNLILVNKIKRKNTIVYVCISISIFIETSGIVEIKQR
jgi:hypothetical protein